MLRRVVMTGFAIGFALSAPVFAQDQATDEPAPPAAITEIPAVPALPTTPAGPVLTLDQAIATAVVNNPGLAAARERVERSRNQVREARAQSRFTVNLSAGYTRSGPVSTITFPGPDGPTQVQTRPPSSTTASATIAQPLDISGALRLSREVAGLQLDIQEFAEAQNLQQLIASVQVAYYNVLRAQGNVGVAQSSLTVAQERLRLAVAQFNAGVSPRFDVTRAQVDVANLQQTLVQAQAGVEAARGILNQTIGLDVNRPFTVEDQTVAVAPVTVDIPAVTTTALTARPEVQQARAGIAASESAIKLTSTQDKPTLALVATESYTSGTSAFSSNKTNYTYGASVNWPIWNGGVTRARVAEARNDANTARRTLDQAALAVELDVRTAALNVMESSRRVQTAEANVTLAQEALRLARVRYTEGVSTEVEVTSAEAALTQAQQNAVSARYDFLTAQAQLLRATASQPQYTALVATPSAPSANSLAPEAQPVPTMPQISPKIVEPKNPFPAEVVTSPTPFTPVDAPAGETK